MCNRCLDICDIIYDKDQFVIYTVILVVISTFYYFHIHVLQTHLTYGLQLDHNQKGSY